MTAVATEPATVAEPIVRRRLRRRPPPAIRNGRALMLSVAGYGLFVLMLVFLGVLINAKGAIGILLPVALITVPLAAVLYGIVRVTRNRQRWAYLLAVGADIVLALVFGYLIVTMQQRISDPNAVFFGQLVLAPALGFAIASAWHFTRGAAWFNGERERPLKAEEAGARAIDAPLIGGPSAYVSAGPALAIRGPRTFAYLVDVVLSGVLSAVPVAIAVAISGGLRVSPILILGVSDWYLWAAVAPLIYRLTQLAPFEQGRWKISLFIHAPMMCGGLPTPPP